MRTSYRPEDVTFLLTDLTGKLEPMTAEQRERNIQSGQHYSSMLPAESAPSDEYMRVYRDLMRVSAKQNADAIARLATLIIGAHGKTVVLVSLARAGTPVGILLKHYIKKRFGVDVPHYSISIIRGIGIDKNAMSYILENHLAKDIVFVDGWTGKGAITKQLHEALREYPGIDKGLAVVADPAGVAHYYGTRNDIPIPCSCLNSVVSGLISRTIVRDDLLGPTDYHGAVYMEHLEQYDVSNQYVEEIEWLFNYQLDVGFNEPSEDGWHEAERIAKQYGVSDINFVKPSIGEATRVLLRRVPDRVLLAKAYYGSTILEPILTLAKEKNVPVEWVDLKSYRAIGIIKDLADA